MAKTVVGLFSSTTDAQRVKQLIVSGGNVSASDAKIVAQDSEDYAGTEHANSGIGEKVSHFFKSLTGGDDETHNHYAGGLNSGGALLTVKTDDNEAQGVAVLMRENGARNIEDDADTDTGYNDISAGVPGTVSGLATGTTAGYEGTSGVSAARTAAPGYNDSGVETTGRGIAAGETSIPIVEESLVVGKREVDRGGVRVYSHIVEQPVSADVSLRDERVVVERRPVDRVATAADFTPGDRSFEVRATGEEAVIGKNARVVEEVLVGKDSSEHTEVVRDTVRHTEVDVEEVPTTETFSKTKNTL
ncbi:MAG: YsnF/AvaK domain-containing protein [Janthinobacterium lividum]